MTEAPIQGEKTHTKSEKRRAEDSAGCDGIKTSTERCRKCKESNPLPHCIFFIPSKTPNPLLSSVTEWKIGVLTRTLSFMAFESDSAHYSESLFAGGPDLGRPRPSVFFETQDVCSTRNLSGPPPFPCHVSWGLFKCLTRVKDGQIHCEMSGVEKKYIPDKKKIKFYFWRRYLRYLFIYPLIYTHEYIGAYLYVCIYACTISFPPRFTFHPSEPLRRGLFIFLRSYSVLLCSPHTFHLYEKFLFSARICYFTEQGLSYTYMYMYTRVYISMCGIFFIIIIISLPVLLGSCFHFQYFCIWMTKCFFCFYLYIFFQNRQKKKRRWKFVRECFACVWQDGNGKDEMEK